MCRFSECDRKPVGRGLCSAHWRQWSKYGEGGLKPLKGFEPKPSQCTYATCCKPVRSNGLCGGHYKMSLRGEELRPLGRQISALTRDDAGRKWCSSCSHWLHVAAFGSHRSRPDGLRGACKECTRKSSTLDKYSMTQGDWSALLESQGGVCAICQNISSNLVVDHDHNCCPGERTCGECTRGLLCGPCNSAIGLMREDPDIIQRAVTYVTPKPV